MGWHGVYFPSRRSWRRRLGATDESRPPKPPLTEDQANTIEGGRPELLAEQQTLRQQRAQREALALAQLLVPEFGVGELYRIGTDRAHRNFE